MPKQIKTKKKEYYLSVSGFIIKISLLPTPQGQYERLFEEIIEDLWGEGGFISKNKKKDDFEIVVTPNIKDFSVLKKDKKTYHFSWKMEEKKKKAKTYYHLSPYLLTSLIREIVIILLKDEGLLIHSSACIDKKGKMFIFLANKKGGKTTTANLLGSLKNFGKVADDVLIVRKLDDKWKFFSPPFVEKNDKPVFSWSSKASLFFVKKSDKCSKAKLKGEDLLKRFLPQVWTREGDIDKSTLSVATSFVNENDFFELKNCLDPKQIKKVIYEN